MLQFWQNIPAHLNPVALHLGPLQISWYGLMYVTAFATVYFLVRFRIRTEKLGISFATVQDFFPWGILGLLLGARFGDVFVYDWKYFQNHLSQIFLPFDIHDHWRYIGIYGMSYFGGLIGLAIVFYIFCRTRKINMLEFSDLFAPAVPLAFAFGRIGNFINGEMFGRVTTKFWGMYFPTDFSHTLRHPSQLYEAFLEGILLFAILWLLRWRKYPVGYLTAFYLVGSGLARAAAEFFRVPDNGWLFLSLTFGQWLSVSLIIAGATILLRNRRPLPKN